MKTRRLLTFLLIALLLVSAAIALAETNIFEIERWTINASSETMTGGPFLLSGNIGDISAGPAMSGDDYVVTGGFLFVEQGHSVYLPVIVR